MRDKLLPICSAFLLPLVLGWGAARAADRQDAGGFKILLTDGSLVNGAVSFVINLDTPYGQMQIPSSSLVSVKFDAKQKWAEIQLTDAQMKLRYDPATSDLKATTSVGSLTIAAANVIRVARASADVASRTSPNAAASQSAAASRPSIAPPAATYAPHQPVTPPTVQYPYVYQYPYQYPYPYQYQYAPPATYYSPYYSAPYYGPGVYVGWPYFGIGIGVGPRFFGGLRWGFGLRIR